MPQETKADLFIRLLTESLETDRLVRKANMAVWHKANAGKSAQTYRSDVNHAMQTIEPLDCIQLMKTKTPDLGIG